MKPTSIIQRLVILLITLMSAIGANAPKVYANNTPSNTTLASFATLKLVNNQLCTSNGNPIQLRGWSTHGSLFKYCYDDKEDFQRMKNAGANVVRIAQYVTEGEGVNETWVKSCIDNCAQVGLYCIVDWHVIDPGNPNDSRYSGYKNFFPNITSYVKQKGYHHVLYEICNEPYEDTEGSIYHPEVWQWVRNYAANVLPIIKKNDPNAIVIVGTPQWDRALVFPMEDPLDENGLNVMYSFHFYAGDQERFLGILSSAAAFIPVFVSEWGVSSHSGNDGSNLPSSNKLMTVCNGKNLGGQIISWCNWAWYDNGTSSSAFTYNGYNNQQFSSTGQYIKQQLAQGDTRFAFCESTPYQSKPAVLSGTEDFYLPLEKYDLGGNNNAYYDFDEEWLSYSYNPSTLPFNVGAYSGEGPFFRSDEGVDILYTDNTNTENCYRRIGYITEGEWVRYTIDVKKAGDYEFETYTNNHIDDNMVAFAVDGRNALVDQDGNEVYLALKLQTSGNGQEYGGYSDWGWTTPSSTYDTGKTFRIRFKETGLHTLGIAFMTTCSGLGSLKLKKSPISHIATSIDHKQKQYDSKNQYLYNLQGQRVTRLVKGGIYIQNGKKTIVH